MKSEEEKAREAAEIRYNIGKDPGGYYADLNEKYRQDQEEEKRKQQERDANYQRQLRDFEKEREENSKQQRHDFLDKEKNRQRSPSNKPVAGRKKDPRGLLFY